MIVVRVEMHSARTGQVSELGRMHICNEGTGTQRRGNYRCTVLRKGQIDDRKAPTRACRVSGYPRLSYPVWRLVLRALRGCFAEEK